MENKENDKLLLTAPSFFSEFAKQTPFHKRIAEGSEKLGIVLQEKIVHRGYLDRADVEEALRSGDRENASKGVWELDMLSLLIKTWKYGEELGRAMRFDYEAVFWERYKCKQFEKRKQQPKSIASKVLAMLRGNRQRD